MNELNIAVVGASGLVGQKILQVIEEFDLQFTNLYLYTSKKSAGKTCIFKNTEYKYIELNEDTIEKNLHLAFFSCGATNSLKYAPLFAKNKTYVVDNSSAFRKDANKSLVIPQINGHVVKKGEYIISNPNCSTTQALLPLKVIDNLFNVLRVDYVTYQAVSGSGIKGIEDLKNTNLGLKPKLYNHPIANNVISQIGDFDKNLWTDEEVKMVQESQKILEKVNLKVSALCVRVPVLNSHCVSLNVETKIKIDLNLLKSEFLKMEGLVYLEGTNYPTPLNSNEKNEVFVGRLKKDLFDENKVHLICCSDNLRKGAATNTVQIGMLIINKILKSKDENETKN